MLCCALSGVLSSACWALPPSFCPAVQAREGQEGWAGPDAGHRQHEARAGPPAWWHCSALSGRGGGSMRRGHGGQSGARVQVLGRPQLPQTSFNISCSTCLGALKSPVLRGCMWRRPIPSCWCWPEASVLTILLNAPAAWDAWPRCSTPLQTMDSSCPRQVCSRSNGCCPGSLGGLLGSLLIGNARARRAACLVPSRYRCPFSQHELSQLLPCVVATTSARSIAPCCPARPLHRAALPRRWTWARWRLT